VVSIIKKYITNQEITAEWTLNADLRAEAYIQDHTFKTILICFRFFDLNNL
jgi:hypothetical protein